MPSEEETIIIGGGRKQARSSVVPQGVECPKVMAKKYTTYIWGFVAALPELYTSVLALGPVPDSMRHILWGTAAFGLACSWIKQRIDQA
jgi:hypothetical protein